MALIRWCLTALLMSAKTVHSDTTSEGPLILNDVLQESPPPPIIVEREGEFENTNPTHVNGEELYQSDILLTREQKRALTERKATPYLFYRWTNGPSGNPTVPYVFGDSLVDQNAVRAAMAHWEQHTCIRFTPASNLTAPYLRFIYGSGCWSYIGMIYAGQDISIGNGCTILGIVAHEIGHALGLFHEQSRSDRDAYVYVNIANVISGRENNFRIEVDNNYSVPYDYSSDMHYGDNYFTKNGYPTLITKDPMAQPIIGQRTGLSHYDKLLANRMYPCISKWLTACGLSVDPCRNNGYTGATCTCVCPPGTTGSKCETITGDYYANLRSSCSQVVTTPGIISSPNYPNNYPYGLKCMTVIKAPACTTIQLKILAFRLYPQTTSCNGNLCCYYDFLEIRNYSPLFGTVYCDTMISPGQIFTSPTGEMYLYFRTNTNIYTGWSVEVSFIPIPGCTTTTTSTTTTTTTSTTTTIPLASPYLCPISVSNNGGYHWTSPRFGLQNYLDNVRCGLNYYCSSPKWMTITFNQFSLENRTPAGLCNDFLSFTRMYNLGDLSYCGSLYGTIILPICNFGATFATNSAITSTGFNITMVSRTSSCHQLIPTGGAGSTGIITAPTPATTWQNTGCEWWIEAPVGSVVCLQFTSVSLTGDCTKTSILLNGYGNRTYPLTTTTQYCGTATPPIFTSATNKLQVMYYSSNLNSPFSAKWTVVAGSG